jgi:hypothetical protein
MLPAAVRAGQCGDQIRGTTLGGVKLPVSNARPAGSTRDGLRDFSLNQEIKHGLRASSILRSTSVYFL